MQINTREKGNEQVKKLYEIFHTGYEVQSKKTSDFSKIFLLYNAILSISYQKHLLCHFVEIDISL